MPWHHCGLLLQGANLAAYAVGIAACYIKEFSAARGLVMGSGGIYHVSEVV